MVFCEQLALALDHGAELIEVLHQRQLQEGSLSPPVLAEVAAELALPLSRVQGVASFYNLFALTPPPANRCGVCLGTSCFVRGAERLMALLTDRLASSDWQLESLGCLGACGLGPLLVVAGQVHGPVPLNTAAGLEAVLAASGVG